MKDKSVEVPLSELASRPYLSIEDFARLMDCHRKSVERQIKQKTIPFVYIGKTTVRIDMQKLKREEANEISTSSNVPVRRKKQKASDKGKINDNTSCQRLLVGGQPA